MELYTEKLIKKKMDNRDLTIKSLIIAVSGFIIFFLVGFLLTYSLALTVCFCALTVFGAWYLFKYTNVEYEYSYCNGEFDIDVIYGQNKRKDVIVFDVSNCEVIAAYNPSNDPSIHNTAIRKKHYIVSDKQKNGAYYAIFNDNGTKTMVVFEADEDVLANIAFRARSVFKK